MNEFTIEKAYSEMSKMCLLIVNVIAGDVADGMTEIYRYHEKRLMSQDDAIKILRLSKGVACPENITQQTHEANLKFYENLLKLMCACPPENILFGWVFDDHNLDIPE